MSLKRSGLLVCKFAGGEDFNLTWPGGQTKQSLLKYVGRSIRAQGGFREDDLLEIEVSGFYDGVNRETTGDCSERHKVAD